MTSLTLTMILHVSCVSRDDLFVVRDASPMDAAAPPEPDAAPPHDAGTPEPRAACPGGSALFGSVSSYYARDLALDAMHVYVLLTYGGDTREAGVARAPLAGGMLEMLLNRRSDTTGATALALDAANVYWTQDGLGGSVWKLPKRGGAPVALVPTRSLALSARIHGANLYWSSEEGAGAAITRLPLDGGVPTRLVSTSGGAAADMVLDESGIYWTTYRGDQLRKAPLEGGPATTLVAGTSNNVGGLAVDADAVYFAADGKVMRVAKSGGAPITIAADQDQPRRVAVDGPWVYWVNAGHHENVGTPNFRVVPGAVRKAPKTGGPITAIAEDARRAAGLALDDCYAYWTVETTAETLQIMRALK